MRTKYFKQTKDNDICLELKRKFYQTNSSNVIIAFENDLIIGGLDFEETAKITIERVIVDKENSETIFMHLFSKLLFINYLNKDLILEENIYDEYKEQLANFEASREEGKVKLNLNGYIKRRFIKFGNYNVGKLNNICDVRGVMVGHYSLNSGDAHTGITAILPHGGNIFSKKVIGATYVYNGFGKSIGLTQIDELGTIETPILLTNTLNVGMVADGLVEYILEQNPEIGLTTGTLNPVVLECNDGFLNDIRTRKLDRDSVYKAIKNAKTDFIQGAVGAGSGMTCHGFKGGIGSASRVLNIEGTDYSVGILVNSNFQGSSPKNLIINNNFLGDKFRSKQAEADKGSIIITLATDIPLSERQLKRILKRTVLGIGKTGGFAGNGSGDIIVGFSTANIIDHYPNTAFINLKTITDNKIDLVFKASIDATEEAIINSLFNSHTLEGFRGNIARSINEYLDLFDEILIENQIIKAKD